MLQRGMRLVETLQPSYVAALPCANQMFTRLSWALALGPMHWCQLIPLRGVPGVVRFNVLQFLSVRLEQGCSSPPMKRNSIDDILLRTSMSSDATEFFLFQLKVELFKKLEKVLNK